MLLAFASAFPLMPRLRADISLSRRMGFRLLIFSRVSRRLRFQAFHAAFLPDDITLFLPPSIQEELFIAARFRL